MCRAPKRYCRKSQDVFVSDFIFSPQRNSDREGVFNLGLKTRIIDLFILFLTEQIGNLQPLGLKSRNQQLILFYSATFASIPLPRYLAQLFCFSLIPTPFLLVAEGSTGCMQQDNAIVHLSGTTSSSNTRPAGTTVHPSETASGPQSSGVPSSCKTLKISNLGYWKILQKF